jgi:hypothetical protein
MASPEEWKEEWKRIIMSLPDKEFFPIMRNYLGRIETPFHKPALIDELYNFLSREETAGRVISFIDHEDAQVINAICYLGDPDQKQLQKLLAGSFTYLELHHRMLNLEERLLIYRNREGSVKLSPLFKEIIEDKMINPDLLFPSEPAKPKLLPSPWPTDQLLCALLNMIAKHGGMLNKADGNLRKKVQQDMEERFSLLSVEQLRLFLRGLKLLGIESEADSPDIDALTEMDREKRTWLFMGAVALAADGEERAQRSECRLMAEKLQLFSVQLDPDRLYSEESLRNICAAALLRRGLTDYDLSRYPALLERCGALVREESYYRRALLPGMKKDHQEAGPLLLVQPDFSITLKTDIPLKEAIFLTSFLSLRRYDLYPSYELNRDSFHRGCLFFSPETLLSLLEESGKGIPQNVHTSIRSWEKEIGSISLVRGVILEVGAERRHLVDHDPEVAPFIERTLGPGLYLLNPNKEEGWRKSLEKAGISPLPPVSEIDARGKESDRPQKNWQEPLLERDPYLQEHKQPGDKHSVDKQPGGKRSEDKPEGEDGQLLQEELKKALAASSLGKSDKEELQARIDKKLILFPDQLLPGIGDQEKHEAKGLDYTGKVRLIERALSEKNALLEVVERARGGSPRRVLIKPEELKKSSSDLLLLGKALPDETGVTITVRRISLIRKLKSSLFAPPVMDNRSR